jgi:hypothetical protein
MFAIAIVRDTIRVPDSASRGISMPSIQPSQTPDSLDRHPLTDSDDECVLKLARLVEERLVEERLVQESRIEAKRLGKDDIAKLGEMAKLMGRLAVTIE